MPSTDTAHDVTQLVVGGGRECASASLHHIMAQKKLPAAHRLAMCLCAGAVAVAAVTVAAAAAGGCHGPPAADAGLLLLGGSNAHVP